MKKIFGQPYKLTPPGILSFRQVECDPRLSYYLYLPKSLKNRSELLVAVHGISRNARQQAELYWPHAEQLGMPMIAPLFDKNTFPGFQRLGIGKAGLRADLMLHKAINEAARLIGTPILQLHLIGYSGGAQFAHRFALGYPDRVSTLSLCSAGWYSFPEMDTPYPRGLQPRKAWPPFKPNLMGFLAIPMQIIVGTNDTTRDAALNCQPRIDQQQGRNRLERAKNWQQAILEAQATQGISGTVELRLLEGQHHNFIANMHKANMGNFITSFIQKHALHGSSERIL